MSVHNEGWRNRAACRGTGPGYPFYSSEISERTEQKLERETRAKAICGACAVREACLNYAVRIGEKEGIWGGLNESERKSIPNQHAS